MLAWLSENLATIIVGAIVALLIASVVVYMIRQKKNGKSSCGCGCSTCSACPGCNADKK